MPSGRFIVSALRFAGAIAAMSAASLAHGAEVTWDALAAAAREEGKVVVIGPAHQEVRRVLPAEFKKRFGVEMEYLGGPGGTAASRIQVEQKAGLYTTDVGLAAIQTLANVFYEQKLIAPIRPLLVHPDVLDKSKWRKGDLWFIDPEQEYSLRLFAYVGEMFTINTAHVKLEEITTARELLLNPKWRGKIAAHDPVASGTGSNIASQLYAQMGGEAFLKAFYVDQKPMITRNERQITDWLLRGTYPIMIGGDIAEMQKMRNEGLPVMSIYNLPDLNASISGGNGNLVVFDKAPNPNAAKLLVNWLASREGLEIYARASKRATTRTDINEADFLPVETILQPGVKYFDSYDWEFSVVTKAKVREIMKDLIKN